MGLQIGNIGDQFNHTLVQNNFFADNNRGFGVAGASGNGIYSDFAAYSQLGAAITGTAYRKFPSGPFPMSLYEAEQELRTQNAARVDCVKNLRAVFAVGPSGGPDSADVGIAQGIGNRSGSCVVPDQIDRNEISRRCGRRKCHLAGISRIRLTIFFLFEHGH